MDYQYLAYTQDKKLVKGKLSAHSEQEAVGILEYGGYRVIQLKLRTPFLTREKLLGPAKAKSKEITMLSRQLALLLESGIDIVDSLELLQNQVANYGLKTVIGKVISDIRGGASLSKALSKHPNIFPLIYHRTIAVGEQGGNLKVVLRRMADHMERAELTKKKVTGALRYPIIVFVVAIAVVGILVTYVMPTFATLYGSIGAKLPAITTLLLDGSAWAMRYGLYVIMAAAAAASLGFAYIRTPAGRAIWDRLLLRLPILGRIFLLNELCRCCRSISLLLNVGLPVPETMALAISGSGNKAVSQTLAEVQQDVLRGESLSQSMARRPLFLPLMVAMVAVGEKSGNMVNTVATAAESFETEADDRTGAAVALLQPALTIFIASVVGFIAIAMFSAMYGIYSQLG